MSLLQGLTRGIIDEERMDFAANSILFCISFFIPLNLKSVTEVFAERTWHPPKLSVTEGFNEYDNIRVSRTGRICGIPFDHKTGKGGCLLLKIYGALHIERHATVDSQGHGYSGGWSYSSQGDSVGRCGETNHSANFGGGGGGYYGGGGGFGSKGCTPKSSNPKCISVGEGGKVYGTHFVHLSAYMGSGGGAGGGSLLFSRGGRGGGVIVIVAGSIHNKGRIMSVGQRGKYLAGSGAGGTVVIECNSYYHYGKGAILAASLAPQPEPKVKKAAASKAKSPNLSSVVVKLGSNANEEKEKKEEKKQTKDEQKDSKSQTMSGGIGGYGRVALKINRQKWSKKTKSRICTNKYEKIWEPNPWIYPKPYFVPIDYMNEGAYVCPQFVGFHALSRVSSDVYKNDLDFETVKRETLVNRACYYSKEEAESLKRYRVSKNDRLDKEYNWKFNEFSLLKKQQLSTNTVVRGSSSSSSGRNSVRSNSHIKSISMRGTVLMSVESSMRGNIQAMSDIASPSVRSPNVRTPNVRSPSMQSKTAKV